MTGIVALALNLRVAITSLPPIFPELQQALGLSGQQITVLATIPVLCFGVFPVIAAPLSRRFGEERVLGISLSLVAAGLILRGALPGSLLYPGTVLACARDRADERPAAEPDQAAPAEPGRAAHRDLPALPVDRRGIRVAAGRARLPVRGARPLAGGPVRFSLGLWAVPAAIAFVAWLPQWRYRTVPAAASGAREVRVAVARHALAWQVTAFMGLQSLSYYAALSWLPTLLRDRGATAAHAGDLLALMNVGNAVTCMLIPVLAHRMPGQRVLVVPTVIATAAGLAGALYGSLGSAWAWILLLGLAQGSALGLGIFFTMARAPDPVAAASLSALAQGGGYLLAATGPLAVGLLHASTGGWDIPVTLLLVLCAAELAAGWLAARDRVLPLPGPATRADRMPRCGCSRSCSPC